MVAIWLPPAVCHTRHGMHNVLGRLYKTKLALLATVSTVTGLVLLALSHPLDSLHGWATVSALVADVGANLFTLGLLGVFFQYVGAQDQEKQEIIRVKRILKQAAPSIRDAVLQGFAFTPDALTKVTSPVTLDRVIENCLAVRLGDPSLAHDAYTGLREQVVKYGPRCYDVRVAAVLSRHSSIHGLFQLTVRWEYKMTPTNPLMRFSCVTDIDEFRMLLADPSSMLTWHFTPSTNVDAGSAEAFELLEFAVDGSRREATRTVRAGGASQVLTVDIGPEHVVARRPVALAYTYRTLIHQNGHLLHLDIARPTKGLRAELRYGNCGIAKVNVLDYIAGADRARITSLPPTDPTPSVEIGFDGWVLPKGGVAFIWVLDSECPQPLPRPHETLRRLPGSFHAQSA